MPYLPVDLDGKRKADFVDRAFGLPKGTTIGGLIDAWEHVWRTKSDVLAELYITACFGPDQRIRSGVVEAGFLEPCDGGWRVRGAKKWLLGMEGTKRGGLAAKGNLVPGAKQKKANGALRPQPSPENSLGSSRDPAETPAERPPKFSGVQPRPPLGSLSALSASSQQPEVKEEKKKEADKPPPAALQKLWNDTAHPSLPRWREMPPDRERFAKARLAERPLEEWRSVIERINTSAFCLGANDRGWMADPSFLLRVGTATKVLEGKYDGAAKPKQQSINLEPTCRPI